MGDTLAQRFSSSRRLDSRVSGISGISGTFSFPDCNVCTNFRYLYEGDCISTCPDGFLHIGDGEVGRTCEASGSPTSSPTAAPTEAPTSSPTAAPTEAFDC